MPSGGDLDAEVPSTLSQVEVDENGKIVDARFKTFGCGSAIASSSLATEWVKGKTVRKCLLESGVTPGKAFGAACVRAVGNSSWESQY